MTPTEIETQARQRYNAIGDSFWSQDEIFGLIYNAEMELSLKTYCIQSVYQTLSVSGTSEISMPTVAMAIKRVEYDYRKLEPISDRERDNMLGGNNPANVTGRPEGYWLFGNSIFLVKTPGESGKVIKIFSFDEPSTITSTSTLDVPARYHPYIVDYILARMFSKDSRFEISQYHQNIWEKHLDDSARYELRRKLSDTTITGQIDLDYTFGKDNW